MCNFCEFRIIEKTQLMHCLNTYFQKTLNFRIDSHHATMKANTQIHMRQANIESAGICGTSERDVSVSCWSLNGRCNTSSLNAMFGQNPNIPAIYWLANDWCSHCSAW